jgi:hypothetical protein
VNTVVTSEGVTFTPWADGHSVGFTVVALDGRIEHVYLAPAGAGDVGDATVFVYHDVGGDYGGAVRHLALFAGDSFYEDEGREDARI